MTRRVSLLGILAVLASLPSLALAQKPEAALPSVKLCTGPQDGNYDFSGIQIAQQAKGVLNVTLVQTQGSLDNLARLDKGECDAAIVQSDAYGVYLKQNSRSALNIEKSRVLYQEYLHFICNSQAGLSKITQLTRQHTILIGPLGGGTSTTWESFRLADPKRYDPIPTLPVGGLRAVNMVQEGSQAACLLFVTGLKSPQINEANQVALNSKGKLVLIAADDSDLPKLKDPKGRQIYSKATIPGGTYPGGLQPSSMFGSSVDTIAVDAVFVASTAFIDANGQAYNALLRAVNNAVPAIKNKVEAK
ncbi:TRAP transporter substrate-binding protein [Rhodovastum atsumiense]|uniref:TRAP transporter substrate-binding protein n=1 Tax=Rhodovastum atsumiense TaxID=504468 RepID=A0A5M6IVH5_9PROT|nr:TAXI family TRAP transporter solute-binding subunit [Rhodovastum atsumiense]KAA5611415.1 TRAP transporter substrate-binding protein [Rhodovastum atsumiense]CAH2603566.1 TRAP transporter substrate-binding protein [Rhodovastum atsumiense]